MFVHWLRQQMKLPLGHLQGSSLTLSGRPGKDCKHSEISYSNIESPTGLFSLEIPKGRLRERLRGDLIKILAQK